MANIFDYIIWRGDLPFASAPVCNADYVALSQIALLDLSGVIPKRGSVTLGDAYARFLSKKSGKIGYIIPEDIKALFEKMADSSRFRPLLLHHYVDEVDIETDTQFSALTLDDPKSRTRFVVFSGTDDTLAGWKENFNLLYRTPTVAQIRSVRYLDSQAEDFDGDIYVLGHSKGGHLAMYSSLGCKKPNADKIKKIINLDGPGMPDGLKRKKLNADIYSKTEAFLPQSSIIGRLFEHGETFHIVHSNAKGLFQHDCFSWEILGPDIVREPSFDEDGEGVDACFRTVIAELTADEKEFFVESLFGLMYSTGATTLTELVANTREFVRLWLRADGETKKSLNRVLLLFLKDKYFRKCIFETFKEMRKNTRSGEAARLEEEAAALVSAAEREDAVQPVSAPAESEKKAKPARKKAEKKAKPSADTAAKEAEPKPVEEGEKADSFAKKAANRKKSASHAAESPAAEPAAKPAAKPAPAEQKAAAAPKTKKSDAKNPVAAKKSAVNAPASTAKQPATGKKTPAAKNAAGRKKK